MINPEMESSRPWPWPRGTSRTTGHVLGLGGQVLGLGLGRHFQPCNKRVLGKHVLGLDLFLPYVTVNFITNFENLAIKMKLVISSPAINVCVLKFWLNSEPYWHWPCHRPWPWRPSPWPWSWGLWPWLQVWINRNIIVTVAATPRGMISSKNTV